MFRHANWGYRAMNESVVHLDTDCPDGRVIPKASGTLSALSTRPQCRGSSSAIGARRRVGGKGGDAVLWELEPSADVTYRPYLARSKVRLPHGLQPGVRGFHLRNRSDFMAKQKRVEIELTEVQRAQIKAATGKDISTCSVSSSSITPPCPKRDAAQERPGDDEIAPRASNPI